jgi:uncharacterized repeat protein (TIGR01451 family)
MHALRLLTALALVLCMRVAHGAEADASFGRGGIAISGNTLAVAGDRETAAPEVYVFKRSSPAAPWVLAQRVEAPVDARLAKAIALSQTHLLIGDSISDKVYAFRRASGSEKFVANGVLQSNVGAYGASLAILETATGATLVVGDPLRIGNSSGDGGIDLWEALPSGVWAKTTQFTATAQGEFGESVALAAAVGGGYDVFVGEPEATTSNGGPVVVKGRVRHLRWTGTEWQERAQIPAPTAGGLSQAGYFGGSVAFANGTLFVTETGLDTNGASDRGGVHVYTFGGLPASWQHRDLLPHAGDPGSERPNARWGTSMAVATLPGSSQLLLALMDVGHPLTEIETQHTAVYQGTGGSWSLAHSFEDAPPNDSSGGSVAVSSTDVITEARYADGRFVDQGRVDVLARQVNPSNGAVTYEPKPSLYGYAPPELTPAAASLTLLEDSFTTLDFTLFDADSPLEELTLPAPSTDRAVLFPKLSVAGVGSQRILRIEPGSDLNGSGIVILSASDLEGTKGAASIPVTVIAVNDSPSFELQANPVQLPFASVQQVNDMLHSFSGGPADESSQILLTVQSPVSDPNDVVKDVPRLDDVRLVRDQSGVSADLFYELTGNEGTAQVTVRAFDSGGTANGGENSALGTFQIVVGRPEINLALTNGKGAVENGQAVPYALTVTNAGPLSARVEVSLQASNLQIEGNSLLTLDVPAQSSRTLGLTAIVTGVPGETARLTASAVASPADGNPANNTVTDEDAIVAFAPVDNVNLDLQITNLVATVRAGEESVYLLTVTNSGQLAATEVKVSLIPTNVTIVSSALELTTGFALGARESRVFQIGTTVTGDVGATASISAQATSVPADPDTANNAASDLDLIEGGGAMLRDGFEG